MATSYTHITAGPATLWQSPVLDRKKSQNIWKVEKNTVYCDKTQHADFQGKPPFKAAKQLLNCEKWDAGYVLICFWLSCFGTLLWCPVFGRILTGFDRTFSVGLASTCWVHDTVDALLKAWAHSPCWLTSTVHGVFQVVGLQTGVPGQHCGSGGSHVCCGDTRPGRRTSGSVCLLRHAGKCLC